jgi:hypothetical protein
MLIRSIATVIAATYLTLSIGCGGSKALDSSLTFETLCGEANLPEQTRSEQNLPDQTAKIVGGRECGLPNGTVVKLILLDEEDNQTICSGVRLNRTTILTAAHCLNEFVFSVSVELTSGERLAPTKISLHPEASDLGSLFVNDLALLTIAPPDGEIPPPLVPIADRITKGDRLIVLGFGATDGVSQIGAGLLRVGEMQVNEVTTDSIFSDYTHAIRSNTCFGDSGGPAFVQDGDRGLVLAGITSTGTNVRCAVGDRSAFTNLTNQKLRAFIEEGTDPE